MNHYPHHIGDFNNATRHLTRVERSLYRDLIDLYYDTERPLNSDFNRLARRVLAHSEEERAALQCVLEEFFVLEDDGWHNSRCDAEIEKYQGSIEQASRAGKASAAKRALSGATTDQRPFNGRSTTDEPPLNDRATNQNQNQNQGNTPLTPQGGAPDGARGGKTFPTLGDQDLMADQPSSLIDQAGPATLEAPIADLPPSAGTACTTVGAACLVMKSAGISNTNAGNQKLRDLIAAGAELPEFLDAAQKAIASGNARFTYVLGIVAGERQRAAELVQQLRVPPLSSGQSGDRLAQRPHNNKQTALERSNKSVAEEWLAQQGVAA